MLGLTLTFFAKAGLLGTASQLEFLSSSLQSITGSSTVAGIGTLLMMRFSTTALAFSEIPLPSP